ncbi:MAG: GNAT family N-acetyltransferase [Ktedonobacteraceae bacterium]
MFETLPERFSVCRPRMDDAQRITEMRIACDLVDRGEVASDAAALRTYWQHPGFNLESDAWLITTPDDRFVCYGSIRHDVPTHIIVFHWVHPDFRDRGLGTYLLRVAEARARACIAQAPVDARVSLDAFISERNSAGKRCLEEEGFVVIRHSWQMKLEMNEPPEPAQWPEGMTVRSFVPQQDEQATYETEEEAFQDHWGHIPMTFEQWTQAITQQEDFDPSLTFLVTAGEEIAALTICEYWLGKGLVGTLGVRRNWRRGGVGMALLRHAFGAFYTRGIHTITLNVDAQSLTGATRLYERAGMHIALLDHQYQKELRAGRELSTQTIGD